MTRRILHPSDFSAASSAPLRQAIDMARSSYAQLLIAHVIHPIVAMLGGGYLSQKLFLGSVAGRVDAAAPCPVLTVRGR